MPLRAPRPTWPRNPETLARLTVWPVIVLSVIGLGEAGRFVMRATVGVEGVARTGLGIAFCVVSFFSIAAIGIVAGHAYDAIKAQGKQSD